MNVPQTLRALALTGATAVILTAGLAGPSTASGGPGGGGGGHKVCTITSVTTSPNVIGTKKIAVAKAGSITLVTAASGLTITKAKASKGWTGAIGIATGPKVDAGFTNVSDTIENQVEVRWAPAYYGGGNNTIEIKTCV